jgi:hypothetical protein
MAPKTADDDFTQHGHSELAVVTRFDLEPYIGHFGKVGLHRVDDDELGAPLGG